MTAGTIHECFVTEAEADVSFDVREERKKARRSPIHAAVQVESHLAGLTISRHLEDVRCHERKQPTALKLCHV